MDITNHFYTTNRLEQHLMISKGYTIQRNFMIIKL